MIICTREKKRLNKKTKRNENKLTAEIRVKKENSHGDHGLCINGNPVFSQVNLTKSPNLTFVVGNISFK